MELDTVAKIRQAFYRLVGTTSSDGGLTENSESADDVAYQALTRGFRAAQGYLIDYGFMADKWRKRSSAITSWSGSEASDGGRYTALPTDFLRFARTDGTLVEANGTKWGTEIDETESERRGNYYYVKADNLWITRAASPKPTLYLEYVYKHVTISAAMSTSDITLPMDVRPLGVAMAAKRASADGWFSMGAEQKASIEEALREEKAEARRLARRSKKPNRMRGPVRYGTRW